MALTRANVEAILVKRAGGLMAQASMAVTYTGSNADLNDAIGQALLALGITPANLLSVADIDLVTLSVDDYAALLDVAELRVLENVLGNLVLVDQTVGPRTKRSGQLGERLEKIIERKRFDIAAKYALVTDSSMDAGVLRLDIIENSES